MQAIDAAMAAVKDARGNISPTLAQSKHPTFKVVKQGQSLAEAEPHMPSAAEPAAEEAMEQAGEEQVEPEAGAEAAPAEETTRETPPLSAQMFPADVGPGVMQETIDPRVAGPPGGYAPMEEGEAPPQSGVTAPVMANGMVEQPMSAEAAAGQPVPQSAQIEETMMPQPGMVAQAQVMRSAAPATAQLQPGQTFSSPIYPGARVQVVVKKTSPAPVTAGSEDTCTVGQRQSPVNIELNVESAELPVLAWRLTTAGIVDGTFAPVQEEGQGKWLRAVDAGLAMSVKDADYQLRSLIVHSPSEHAVSGQRYDMEMQFLHSASVGEQQQYLMVSVFVNKADPEASSPVIAALASKMEDMDTAGALTINIRDLAMDVLGQTELVSPTATNAENYFMYDGSFTTAPCTEGVTWVVLKNPLQASPLDIETLAAALPQTNRDIQPVGTRVVQDRHVLG